MRPALMCVVLAAALLVAFAGPAAGQDFLLDWQKTRAAGGYECWWRSFDVPRRSAAQHVRVTVAAPASVDLQVSFDSDFHDDWDWDSYDDFTVGQDGFFQLTHLFPEGARVTAAVSVCDDKKSALTFTARAHVVRQARIPHNSDQMEFDDQLYRDLIFDAYDNPGGTEWSDRSWVLNTKSPKFYIQLGNEYGRCGDRARVSLLAMHYWRAIVPILAEQLTGVPYPHRVESGCAVREPEFGWVTVRHVTAEEYFAETGKEWGANNDGRSMKGAHRGKVWILHKGRPAQPDDYYRRLVAHEIGHAFGLSHTGVKGAMMENGWQTKRGTLHVFTPGEEAAARAAYRAGRGARYCGDPDRCGSGLTPGESRSLEYLPPQIVVD